ncbi:MAG: insulinase family protein [Chitinophagaceae bacterium]|nr:insulinase family protein [Chitinophagaceae bacterium]
MKKLLIIASGLFLASCTSTHQTTSAQIDRSHAPKPGVAPVISVKDPVQFKLDNGMTVLVVENHKFPKVSANLTIDRGPVYEGEKAGVMSLMGSMLSEGTKNKTKAEFDEAVDQMGADVGLSASGGSARSLTRYFDNTFMLMAEALRNPAMKEESFDKLKSMAINALKSTDRSASAISGRVVGALSYGRNTAMGEFQTEESLNGLTLQDVKDAYNNYITPSRSYLTFIGDITPEQAKALAEKAFGDWKGKSLTLPVIPNVSNVAETEIDLVDVPTAVQSEITVTNLVNLPMSSPDYFPVLLANQILGEGSTGRLFQNLREKHGFTYGSYSSIGSGRFQTSFKATAQVRNDKVDSAVAEIMKEINRIRTEKVTEKELDDTKTLYTGQFALSMENPAVPAAFASNILINNLDKDFYRNYLKKISEVTVDDIQRVAQKYFSHDNARIVVVGKELAVKPGLEKLGYPVKMFDKFGEPVTEQPDNDNAAAADITAKDVIDNYIKALGGESAVKGITSMLSEGSMEMQGMNLGFEERDMAPNLSKITLAMGGQPIVTDVFNGEKGWKSQMGQSMDYTEEEVKMKKDNKALIPQVAYFTDGFDVKVAGVEKIDGKDAYKLTVKMPSGLERSEWYDVESGFLVKNEASLTMEGQEIVQTTEYKDYREVGNLKFPFSMVLEVSTAMGQQEMTIKLTSIKVNEGVSKEDFK